MEEERKARRAARTTHNTRKRKTSDTRAESFYINDEESGRAERPADMITRTTI